MQGLNNIIRTKISGTRRRFNEHGYNIDLSYIVENRVIVMSYPAANFKQKMYRNDAKQVKAYLDNFHPGKYWVYNLSEQTYEKSRFEERVSHYSW